MKHMQPEFTVPAIDGIITADQVRSTGQTIADLQLPTGQVPWFPGGHCDPWNHVETAMALDVVGLHTEAAAAYGWLRDMQLPDGSWYQYYLGNDVEQEKFDANTIAYIAVGVWHHWLLTGDRAFLTEYWPVVDTASQLGAGTTTGLLATSCGLVTPMAPRSRSHYLLVHLRSATA